MRVGLGAAAGGVKYRLLIVDVGQATTVTFPGVWLEERDRLYHLPQLHPQFLSLLSALPKTLERLNAEAHHQCAQFVAELADTGAVLEVAVLLDDQVGFLGHW